MMQTPNIKKSLKFSVSKCNIEEMDKKIFEELLQTLKEGEGEEQTIEMSVIKKLSQILQKEKEKAMEEKISVYVHQLLRGATPKVNIKPEKKKNPEFEKKMEEIRRQYEAKLYRKMVSGVVNSTEVDKMRDKRELKDFKSQMNIGLNMIVTRIALFAAGYFIGKNIFGDPFW